MSRRKRRPLLNNEGDEDPTSSLVNLTDAMLVLAVGFLIFAMMGIQNNPALLTESTGDVANTVTVETGNTLDNNTATQDSGSGTGYSQVGTVYQDPDTGQLILIK